MAFKKEQIIFDREIPFVMYETNARQVMIHSHDCLEINLILKGSGHYLIENCTYPINAQDIFIINNVEHHMAVHDGSLSMLVIVFEPGFVWSSPDEYSFLNPFFQHKKAFSNTVDRAYPQYGKMLDCIKRMQEEYTACEEGWELMLKSNLLMFLAYLNRYYMQFYALYENRGQEQGYSRIRGAVEYIHAHFDKKLTLQELAGEAAMGKSYFSAYFSDTMKMTVFDYIERVRVNHAAVLLKTTPDSILDIALQSGFESSSYFNRVFKKIMKMTPGNYRKSKDRTIL